GPVISQIAAQIRESTIPLPRPMLQSHDYDFSFSGLKTAVLYKVRQTEPEEAKSKTFIQQICFETQESIIDVLTKKTIQAAKDFKVKSVILGGGVSANQRLRRRFASEFSQRNLPVIIPQPSLSTDNGVMIAVAGWYHRNQKTNNFKKITVDANLRLQ